MKKEIVLEVKTEKLERQLARLQNQFQTVYTEGEVDKLLNAIEEKYSIPLKCDGLPYQMKHNRILKGFI